MVNTHIFCFVTSRPSVRFPPKREKLVSQRVWGMEVRKELPLLTCSKGVLNQQLWRLRKWEIPHEGSPHLEGSKWGRWWWVGCGEAEQRTGPNRTLKNQSRLQEGEQTAPPHFPRLSQPPQPPPCSLLLTSLLQPSSPALLKHIARAARGSTCVLLPRC